MFGGQGYLVLEGYLLFHDPEIAKACDVCIFLDADEVTCCTRRFTRQARRPWPEFSKWYTELVWPHYVRYLPIQMVHVPPENVVDGGGDADGVYSKTLSIVKRVWP